MRFERCLPGERTILRPMIRPVIWLLCLVILTLSSACQRRDQVRTTTDAGLPAVSGAAESDRRTILIAPVASGPLASINPDARVAYAHDLAERLGWSLEDARVVEDADLPDSDAREWQAGPVPAAAGAYLVVLTRVVEISHAPGLGAVQATVEMKAVDPSDPAGAPIFFKRAHGHADAEGPSKLLAAGSRPESAAVWDACATLEGALATLLEATPDQSDRSADGPVDVRVDSDPAQAQVLIDGHQAGTTPATLHLPRKQVLVRIELAGYQPWERPVVPSSEMRIQPVLRRIDATTSPSSASGSVEAQPGIAPATGTASGPAAPHDPPPTRATIDPTMSPPTPAQLVVPDGK